MIATATHDGTEPQIEPVIIIYVNTGSLTAATYSDEPTWPPSRLPADDVAELLDECEKLECERLDRPGRSHTGPPSDDSRHLIVDDRVRHPRQDLLAQIRPRPPPVSAPFLFSTRHRNRANRLRAQID